MPHRSLAHSDQYGQNNGLPDSCMVPGVVTPPQVEALDNSRAIDACWRGGLYSGPSLAPLDI